MHTTEILDDDLLTDINGGGICWAGVTAAVSGVCAGVAITVASGGIAPAAVGLIYLASIACSVGATVEGCR